MCGWVHRRGGLFRPSLDRGIVEPSCHSTGLGRTSRSRHSSFSRFGRAPPSLFLSWAPVPLFPSISSPLSAPRCWGSGLIPHRTPALARVSHAFIDVAPAQSRPTATAREGKGRIPAPLRAGRAALPTAYGEGLWQRDRPPWGSRAARPGQCPKPHPACHAYGSGARRIGEITRRYVWPSHRRLCSLARLLGRPPSLLARGVWGLRGVHDGLGPQGRIGCGCGGATVDLSWWADPSSRTCLMTHTKSRISGESTVGLCWRGRLGTAHRLVLASQTHAQPRPRRATWRKTWRR